MYTCVGHLHTCDIIHPSASRSPAKTYSWWKQKTPMASNNAGSEFGVREALSSVS